MNEIIAGDCKEVLKTFPDNYVNLIVTSPPYADARKKTYGGCSTSEYLNWFLPISQELYRVLKQDGSFILNIKEKTENGERSTYVIELVLALKKQGWKWIDEFIWYKKNPMPNDAPTRFKDGWEHCYHFSKSLKPQIFKNNVRIPASEESIKRYERIKPNDYNHEKSATGSGMQRNWDRMKKVASETVLPSNVLYIALVGTNTGHSAAYPIALPTWFIKAFSKETDIILDPFCGSGTTCLAAKELGRQYIGIELNPEYAQITKSKLNGYRILDHFTLVSSVNPLKIEP